MDNFDYIPYGYYLFIYLFIYLLLICLNSGILRTILHSFPSILKLQHPFTQSVARPSSPGKSTFIVRMFGCREQTCNIVFENIIWCHSENNA